MLHVTTAAVAALEQARTVQQVPDDHGVRVSAEPDPQDPESAVLALGFAEAPAESDEVTDHDGTTIFVAAEVAEPLAATILDVEDTPEGAQLVLRPQEGAED